MESDLRALFHAVQRQLAIVFDGGHVAQRQLCKDAVETLFAASHRRACVRASRTASRGDNDEEELKDLRERVAESAAELSMHLGGDAVEQICGTLDALHQRLAAVQLQQTPCPSSESSVRDERGRLDEVSQSAPASAASGSLTAEDFGEVPQQPDTATCRWGSSLCVCVCVCVPCCSHTQDLDC